MKYPFGLDERDFHLLLGLLWVGTTILAALAHSFVFAIAAVVIAVLNLLLWLRAKP